MEEKFAITKYPDAQAINKQLNVLQAYDAINKVPLTSTAYDGSVPDKISVQDLLGSYTFPKKFSTPLLYHALFVKSYIFSRLFYIFGFFVLLKAKEGGIMAKTRGERL